MVEIGVSSRTSRASLGCGCGCVVCTAAGRTSPALATPETQPNPPLIASAPLPCGFSFISFGFKNRALKFKLLNFSLRFKNKHSFRRSLFTAAYSWVGGRLILHGGRAHGLYFTEIKCDDHVRLKNKPLTSRGVGAVEHRPTAWGGARPAFRPKHNHAKSALRGARAPWAVGPYSTGRTARGPRGTGL